MNVQTLTKPILACSLFPNFRLVFFAHEPAIQVSPQEFGYELDEAELETEWTVLPLKNQQAQVNQDVQSQEFEACYTWFIS
jgi:hypothetical protein